MQKANQYKLKPAAKPLSNLPERKSTPTEQIASKMTSKTLVEFRNQNAQVPEWRLQLQNAVQQRLKTEKDGFADKDPKIASLDPAAETSGAAAAKSAPSPGTANSDNRHLANALKRIESSRNRYLVPEPEPTKTEKEEAAPKKDFPFKIASRTENPDAPSVEAGNEAKTAAKPKLVKKKKSKLIKDLYDTSELDPNFAPARLSSSFTSRPAADPDTTPRTQTTVPAPKAEASPAVADPAPAKEVIAPEPEPSAPEADEAQPELESKDSASFKEADEFDDYASFGMRFNAGMFDFLIGSFLSFVLLLPFVIAGGNWFTFSGLLAFLATCSIVMFIYLTASVGLAGKSFGMHIFSLEMIDIGGENYPTLHQSAVSAAVYLVSTACLGLGFATALFDDDRRAAHDLLSGTLVVREL